MKHPLISITVLTYNQEKTIARTLDCILNQKTDYPFELIIGEDCSKDNTRAICENYAAEHPEIIKLLPAAPNKGLLLNLRDAYAECQGKYIAGCAGDDWWHNPNKLQLQVEYMEAHPYSTLVFTNYNIYQSKWGKLKTNSLTSESLDTSNIINKLLLGFFLPSLTTMFRRDLLQDIDLNLYHQKGYAVEDLPMYLSFALHGSLDCINISTATYTVAAGSLSHFSDSNKQETFLQNIQQIKFDFIDSHPALTEHVSKEAIENETNRAVFNGSFALYDRKKALSYTPKFTPKSKIELLKVGICKFRPLFWLYSITKKGIEH